MMKSNRPKKYKVKSKDELAKHRLEILEFETKIQRWQYLVFHDRVFIEAINKFKQRALENLDGSIFSTYDLDFRVEIGEKVTEKLINEAKELAKKYHLSNKVLFRYMDGGYVYTDDTGTTETTINMIYHQVSFEDGNIILKMSPHINQKQFFAAWQLVDAQKKDLGVTNTKVKHTDYEELLYWVTRYIDDGHTLPEAFEAFDSTMLPGYSYPEIERLFVYKDFSDWYNKHKFH